MQEQCNGKYSAIYAQETRRPDQPKRHKKGSKVFTTEQEAKNSSNAPHAIKNHHLEVLKYLFSKR